MRPPHILALLAAAPVAVVYWHWTHPTGTHCGSCLGAALAGDLATLNNAVALYRDEHGRYPPFQFFERQLCHYSNAAGETSPSHDEAHPLGPYIRSIPPMPMGPQRGRTTVGDHAMPGIAWVYDELTGEVRPNAPAEGP